MALSADLVSQLLKATKTAEKRVAEATVYGTAVEQEGGSYVQLDGSDVLTPVSTTVKVKSGDRVIVRIKDHFAVVTGNLTSRAANGDDIEQVSGQITDVEILVTDQINAVYGRIDTLVADNVVIKESLTATNASIENLTADNVVINEKLTANEASIENLKATSLTADIADLKYATIGDLQAVNAVIYNLDATYAKIDSLDAINANITNLQTDKLSAKDADIKYANVDFANITEAAIQKIYSEVGIIEDLVMSDGRVTGTLVGVEIHGDLIIGETIRADKLLVKGEDGLYYKLNIEGGATTSEKVSEEDLQNGLSGSIIVAKSITAEKVAVDDLVAFGATIGGFHITNNSLYSGVKESVDNTTRGIYQDADGQFAVGDASNFLKFYKDSDGNYKLAISAESMTFSATGKNVEETMRDEIDKVEVGGRNYLLGTDENPRAYTFSGWQVYLANENQNVTTFKVSDELLSKMVKGQTLTLSANIQNTTDTNDVGLMLMVYTPDTTDGYRQYTIMNSDGVTIAPGESGRAYITRALDTKTVTSVAVALRHSTSATEESTVLIDSLKLELGNKPTDWTPAPEDMATSEEVESAHEANRNTNDEVARAHSLIQQLSDSISMLVTDENGTSLMTQTADGGWTFSMAQTNSTVSDISDQLDALQKETGDTRATVDTLQQAVNDIGSTMEYVRISVYEDEPCIELGESDSDFSLMITNTRIMFRTGAGIPTLINTSGLVTENIQVNNDLKQGYWVRRERKNGNLGLRWQYAGIEIIVQPKDGVATTTKAATFSVIASGLNLTYKWQISSNNGSSWGNLSNSANPSLEYAPAKSGTELLRCVITDKYGNSLTSNIVTVTMS